MCLAPLSWDDYSEKSGKAILLYAKYPICHIWSCFNKVNFDARISHKFKIVDFLKSWVLFRRNKKLTSSINRITKVNCSRSSIWLCKNIHSFLSDLYCFNSWCPYWIIVFIKIFIMNNHLGTFVLRIQGNTKSIQEVLCATISCFFICKYRKWRNK